MTGVSRSEGIGFAIARRLVADGYAVFTQGWEAHDAAQPWGAGDVPLREGLAGHLEADLADPEAPEAVLAAARIALGQVDVLVANHAASVGGALEELTAASIDTALVVNVRATLLLVKAFAAGFEGDDGRVILFTSGQGRGPMPQRAALRREQGGAERLRRLPGRPSGAARDHRQRGQPGPDRHRLGDRGDLRARAGRDAARALGHAGRRRTARRMARVRGVWVGDRPGHRLRRRVPVRRRLGVARTSAAGAAR